ncbi:MAG TPA: DUF3105 domain-containing protein [Actinomycetota bacterium]|nr:DUF3105 domain-containing protein [Actinomycetota bacterium]
MAKKKRKKKPTTPRPAAQPVSQAADAQGRQERKEAARREREERIKRARRRQRLRRLVRWVAILAVIALIVGFIWWRGAAGRRVLQAADAAAERIGCEAIVERDEKGRSHEPPYEYTERPATSGSHAPSTLDPAVSVYDDPIDVPAGDQGVSLEPQAVHNLEHAYVIMYYRSEGPQALPDAVVQRLTQLAEREEKVILAPYSQLPQGTSLTLAAWTRVQQCPAVRDAGAAEQVARGFIQRFRGGGDAPEPTAP